MERKVKSLLSELFECIRRDMGRFRKRVGCSVDSLPSANNTSATVHRRKFALYLMSVATHPIGLLASVSPFNCDSEQILAYIAEVFAIDNEKLREMFHGKTQDRPQPIKRHSWRPELRIRIKPPRLHSKSIAISQDSIQVRVYIFKEEHMSEPAGGNKSSNQFKSKAERSRWLLEHIFKLRIVESSNLIRPVNEMRSLIKFKPQNSQSNTGVKQTSSMLGISRGVDGKIAQDEGDLYVNIRRYYCDPKAAHILRFEFWTDCGEKQLSRIDKYRRAIRHCLSEGSCSTRLKTKTAYMDESQEFYGYINFRLTQLASYPIKKNFIIKTLQNTSLASCEILLEPKNRRVKDEMQDNQVTRLSYNRYVINHMRLYANLVLYQCLEIETTLCALVGQTQVLPNITIDNLFYMPAHTLINQHRLQSNLNKNEDSNLRRISLWSLLINVEQLNETSNLGLGARLVIMSILKTDYMTDRTKIDTKTMQETDPFQDWFDADSGYVRSLIVEMELEILRKFYAVVLQPRLTRMFGQTQVNLANQFVDRSMTLLALNLYNSAIGNLTRTNSRLSVINKYPHDIGPRLREPVEQLLCELLVSYVYERILQLSKQEDLATKDRRRIRSRRVRIEKTQPIDDRKANTDSWNQLLQELRYIDQDLRLNWCRDGLRGLVMNQGHFVKTLKLFESLKKNKIIKTIKAKLNRYMSDRSSKKHVQ